MNTQYFPAAAPDIWPGPFGPLEIIKGPGLISDPFVVRDGSLWVMYATVSSQDKTGQYWPEIRAAVSSDGVTWSALEDLIVSMDTPHGPCGRETFSCVKTKDRWVGTLTSWPSYTLRERAVYITFAESPLGPWTKPARILRAQYEWQGPVYGTSSDGVKIINGGLAEASIFEWDKTLCVAFGGSNDTERIGMAWSPDGGASWFHYPQPVLDLGSKGSWESGFVGHPSVLVTKDNLLLMAYMASMGNKQAIGLALADKPHGPWLRCSANPVVLQEASGMSGQFGGPCLLLGGNTLHMWGHTAPTEQFVDLSIWHSTAAMP